MALDAIVAHKHEVLRKKATQIEALRTKVVKSDLSLISALRQKNPAFIFEIKPTSPSIGVLRPHADISAIANMYAPFAQVISVLADEQFFGGSLANVRQVASHVSIPVLAKDVVVSPLQIIEARAHGAHAILLMLSVLDDDAYGACVSLARELNMEFITEVHTDTEMERANRWQAPIIGINNRNLKTLSIDLAVTERLAPQAHSFAMVIAESGIAERRHIKRLAPLVDGFLIGTALMRAERIDLAVRELIFGRVKICGLTHQSDAQAAYDAGAYYGGLNFWPHSLRFVRVDEAAAIMRHVPLVFGGVFVNQSVDEICEIATKLNLSFVQIHGDETDDFLQALRMQLPRHVEVWRAIRVTSTVRIPNKQIADRWLLDGFSPKDYGGTGTSFDWSQLVNVHVPFILAGGITPENISKADSYEPFAIDVASGVEEPTDPRRKSNNKLRQLFFELRPRGNP